VNRNQINTNINNRYTNINNRPFTSGWYGNRPGHLPARPYHPWHRPGWGSGHWWKWATAATVTRWITYPWRQPVYYGYGSGGNVYYEGDTVYVDGEAECTAEEYYEQADQIASSAPEIPEAEAEDVEWMSLGVFAVAKEGVSESNMLLQLAVTKDGMIGGTFYNESTEESMDVEGMIDKDTQRACWSPIGGEKANVVMETGIYNLTEDECTALVHFGAEQAQTWALVRLDEPEE